MKKLLFLLFLPLFISCANYDAVKTYDYEVIDTTEVCRDNFNAIYAYKAIIMIDSSCYSATLAANGKLAEVGNKLKNITKKK